MFDGGSLLHQHIASGNQRKSLSQLSLFINLILQKREALPLGQSALDQLPVAQCLLTLLFTQILIKLTEIRASLDIVSVPIKKA
ncbi:MAG: hypothetical protein Q8K17_00325, partial [Pseudohongiella sp.]|nr:hypothetical protein [Pseudohongiella sp.]